MNKKIVLLDDVEVIGKSVRHIISNVLAEKKVSPDFIEFEHFTNYIDFSNFMETHSPDLVFIDLNLNIDVSGFDVLWLEQHKKAHPECDFWLLTASSKDEVINLDEKMRLAGFAGFLEKRELTQKMGEFLIDVFENYQS